MQTNNNWQRNVVKEHMLESIAVKQQLIETCTEVILTAAQLITTSLQTGGTLFLCGNGGSAADCQHLAAEFTNRLTADFERPPIPAIALTTDTSFITAHANDYEFVSVFSRQIKALGKPGDILLGISTSGNSKNVVKAVEVAHAMDLKSITLTGNQGRLIELGMAAIAVPSDSTQYIQEAHIAIEHILCHIVERMLFNAAGTQKESV